MLKEFFKKQGNYQSNRSVKSKKHIRNISLQAEENCNPVFQNELEGLWLAVKKEQHKTELEKLRNKLEVKLINAIENHCERMTRQKGEKKWNRNEDAPKERFGRE